MEEELAERKRKLNDALAAEDAPYSKRQRPDDWDPNAPPPLQADVPTPNFTKVSDDIPQHVNNGKRNWAPRSNRNYRPTTDLTTGQQTAFPSLSDDRSETSDEATLDAMEYLRSVR